MVDSILTSTKKILGIAEDSTGFDMDIITHINSVFLTLKQLRVGPADGFVVEDATSTWDEFLGGDIRLNAVRTYVYLKVRLFFDPPTTSFLLAAMQKQVEELEWRLNAETESMSWVPSTTNIDGGGALVVDDVYN